jgi:N-methylhydantoinase A/oxoprolinase/acetone carboxylase beta subunit
MYVDCRYVHQGYELTVQAPIADNSTWLDEVRRRFEEAHKREFGGTFDEFRIQLVAVRARGRGITKKLSLPTRAGRGEPSLLATAEVLHLTPSPMTLSTPVYDRESLGEGVRLAGPALIEQLDTTTIIPPNAEATTKRDGTLVVELMPPTDRQGQRADTLAAQPA